MDARKLVLPAMALVGGALLGRLVGIKGLVRAGMAAFTIAKVSQSAGLLAAGKRGAHGKAVQRTARKRSGQRKSAPKKAVSKTKSASKTASVPASTQTH